MSKNSGWMLRACFYLLAIVILTEMLSTIGGLLTCYYLLIASLAKTGDCTNLGQQVKELWSEVLAGILALLLAAKNESGDDPNG